MCEGSEFCVGSELGLIITVLGFFQLGFGWRRDGSLSFAVWKRFFDFTELVLQAS